MVFMWPLLYSDVTFFFLFYADHLFWKRQFDDMANVYYLIKNSFFTEIRRIGDPNYIPTEQDVLRARLKSTGIMEIRFKLGGLSIQ